MIPETPIAHYERLIASQQLFPDAFQASVVAVLQGLYEQIVASTRSAYAWQPPLIGKKKTPVRQGLYLWGGVGRGKTLLVDMFYESLPISKKWRVHFHHLMKEVHQAMFQLKQEKNPLKKVAKQMASKAQVICIDEFFISDIGDAMILSEWLSNLLSQGVVLVFTSNTPPKDLYLNGLQRSKFLPTISLIETQLQVFALESPVDYRLRVLDKVLLYYYPITEENKQKMTYLLRELAPECCIEDAILMINDRRMTTYAVTTQVIWLDFHTLFVEPRGVSDYIELAQTYHTIMISHVVSMGEAQEDVARRFIAFIDECYDHSVKIVILAEAPYTDLYQGALLVAAFERTQSRLAEMQSHQYLMRPHRLLGPSSLAGHEGSS